MHSMASTTVPARLAAPTSSLSGVVVSSLSADAVSSTTIRLSWQLLQPQRHAVEGFRIKYRPLDDADDDVVDYLVKVVRPGDVVQFLLTGTSRAFCFYALSYAVITIAIRRRYDYDTTTIRLRRIARDST